MIRSELFLCRSEIISGGKTPGRPRAVINFPCLGCNHRSEKRWRLGMIDDGRGGDGPWSCSTSLAPLIAGAHSEGAALHLRGINKATGDPAEHPIPEGAEDQGARAAGTGQGVTGFPSMSSNVTRGHLCSACVCGCGCHGCQDLPPGAPLGWRHSLPTPPCRGGC